MKNQTKMFSLTKYEMLSPYSVLLVYLTDHDFDLHSKTGKILADCAKLVILVIFLEKI